MHMLANQDLSVSNIVREIKLAIVGQNEITVSLCEQYIEYCKALHIPWQIETFPELALATEWVKL